MRNFRLGFVCLLTALLVVFVAGCGQETVTIPSVVSVTPAQGAAGVAVNTAITATFSQAMNPASITATTFTLAGPGGVAVAGAASSPTYSGVTATFTPAVALAFGTTYTATITTGATTPGGEALMGNYVWSFSTVAAIPPSIPAVVVTTPVQGEPNVAVNTSITAGFNIAMSPASINGTTTFTVYAPGGVAVAGSAVLNGAGTVATFTPTSGTLPFNNTTYTATITTAAKSVGGVPIVANYVWSFTTIAAVPPSIPAVVPPPTPAPFASGVSLTSATAPISVTFNQPMSCASLQTAFTVTAPAGDVAVTSATPAVTCVLNGSGNTVATFMPTGGALPSYSTTYTATIGATATDTAGTAMAGAYVWSFTTLAQGIPFVSSVTPTQGHPNVPITGAGAAITATFNQAMTAAPFTAAGTFTVYAPNGVQVPGSAVLSTSGITSGLVATFTPTSGTLANNTTYTATITKAATSSVGGVPIVANYVWSFTTITAAPTVIATDPVTPSTVAPIITEDESVPLNQVITANFSEAMLQVDSTNFALTPTAGGAAVSGTVAYIPGTYQLVFVPGGLVPVNLLPNTEYTATITGGASGVTDLAGTVLQVTAPMVTNYTWNFHTVTGTSTIAPELVFTVPGDPTVGVDATNVPITQAVSATFSEGMNTQTLFGTSTSTADFLVWATLDPTKTPLAGMYKYDPVNFIATFTPTSPLTINTSYTATVVGATDLFGNVLGNSPTAPYTNTWTFTTGAAAVQPPVVLGPTITPFGGFGGAGGMTNMGTSTVIHGDIGTIASSTVITGFHDDTVLPVVSAAGSTVGCTYTETGSNIGLVTGTIYTDTPPPTIGCPNEGTAATMAIATEAALEALTAYNTLQSSTNPAAGTTPAAVQGTTLANTELGGTTLYPGVYWSASIVDITLVVPPAVSSTLTLDAQGDPNAYFVFQVGSALTVGKAGYPANIILANGAQASHVFWVCGSAATINGVGGGTFNGTVIADAAISTGTSGIATVTTINGRLISLGLSSPSASTTVVNTVINVPPAQ